MSSTPSAPSPSSPPSPPSAPPPSNSTAPPPATPSAPPPSNSTSPPPATPSAPPPATPSAPPPATPSAPPPATPSTPPPATPSAPPPSNSTSPPPSSSPPPPATPSVSPPPPSSPGTPATPSNPSPPAPGGKSPPSGPLPPSSRTPPSAKSPPSPPSSPSNSISTSAVVGIAVGAVAVLVVLSLICICCRKKRRRAQPPMEYYGGPPPPLPPRKDDPYGGQPQNWQHNAPLPADHIVKIPPQPTGPPPPHASRPPHLPTQFSAPPPPPPPVFSSGGSGSTGSELLPPPSPGFTPGFSKNTFTFEELALATDRFSDANLLGQGGFGYVHKGVLPNGKEVAIKQLKSGSGQGEREFQAEVEIISRVHHRHLVTLVGYCISGGHRLLVYEYVPNKTLEYHLHEKDRPTMEWSTRLKIALGSAKGLAYLHEDCHPKIIHRDIKSANILLDFKFEAKVADFGLAKIASDNNTHVSTRVMGTFGYMAPEYASSGKLTDRSDVFSFGVMLLELITGRRPVDLTQTFMDDSLVDWARPLLTRAMEDNKYDTLLDPRLGRNYNPNEMARMVASAASCVRHSARRRPRMSQIVRALEGDVSLEDLNEGIRPGHSTLYGTYGSSDYDSSQYNEDMKKFRKMALASRDYASSEYSAPTSEYGQVLSASSSEGQQTREMEMGKMKKDSQGFSSGGQ